jgi:hypothetical protein
VEAALFLAEAFGFLEAAATVADRLGRDPEGTLTGLAALAARTLALRNDPETQAAWAEALRSRGIHPLAVALAFQEPPELPPTLLVWPSPVAEVVRSLAERLGTDERFLPWIGADLNLTPHSTGPGWPPGLGLVPGSVTFSGYRVLDLPDNFRLGGNLLVKTKIGFSLPRNLTVQGNLDLSEADGWDERIPDGLQVKGRMFTGLFPPLYAGQDQVAAFIRKTTHGGTTPDAWRQYKGFEADAVAQGGDFATIRRIAKINPGLWVQP